MKLEVKEDKVNLKKILAGGINQSRISNKCEPLLAASNGVIIDIEIEMVSEKTK